MSDKIHVWLEGSKIDGSEATVSASIETPNQKSAQLWYRVPEQYSSLLTESGDPFVLGTLFMAMRSSKDIFIHGQASPSLLRNLEEFQALWACWQPTRYRTIEITADIEKEQSSHSHLQKAVAAFSGGVDSCFTVWRHKTDSCGRLKRNIAAGLMVHGFDIPLDQKQTFDRAVVRSSKILESLDVELISMASNYRDLGDYWGDAHGAAVASCLMMLQGGYGEGLIGSTWTYDSSLPWGSSPVGDWMLSNCSFQTIHDGAAYSRADKVGVISRWPEALRYLRVCWAGDEKDQNCCCCEKCIRTILNFRALGLGLPDCFEQDVTNQQIANLTGLQITPIGELKRVLTAAKARSITDSWVSVLEMCIKKNQRALVGWSVKRIKDGIRRRVKFAEANN